MRGSSYSDTYTRHIEQVRISSYLVREEAEREAEGRELLYEEDRDAEGL